MERIRISQWFKKNAAAALVFLFPFAIALVFYFLRSAKHPLYFELLYEDGLLENAEVFCYFTASCYALNAALIYRRRRQRLLMAVFFGWSLLLFFAVGEEINWGQRIFGFETTQFFMENNAQKEMSLHNLKPVHGSMNAIFKMIGIAGTLLCLVGAIPRLLPSPLQQLMPSWYLAAFFFLGYLVCKQITKSAYIEQELTEFFYSTAFLMYNVRHHEMLTRTPTQSPRGNA